MIVKELFSDNILDFLTGKTAVDDYLGLSMMTDGLKATRDHVIGFSAVDNKNEILCTILLNEGDAEATQPYHGIPSDAFHEKGVSPVDGYAKFAELIEGKYLVTHNYKFTSSFMAEFCSRNGLPPMTTPLIGSDLLYKAYRTADTFVPNIQEDRSITDLMWALQSLSYPRGMKASLEAIYGEQPDAQSDYVNRLPNGVGNAFRIAKIYERFLALPVFD